MVNLTLEEWQRQSSLLLQARPTTTRIVTKYNVPNLESARYQKSKKRKREPETDGKDATPAPKIPKAVLTLKTFCPLSGVVLQFKTDKGQDVGRLIAGLGRLSRHMAALPEKTEDVAMQDNPAGAAADGAITARADGAQPATAPVDKPQQPGAGKKKKKGKK